MLETMPNLEGLQESLWGNSVALAVSVIIGIVLVLLVFRFLRKTVMRIIVLVLAVLVVGFFASRVAGDAIELDGLKNLNLDCEPVVWEDGSLKFNTDKPCF